MPFFGVSCIIQCSEMGDAVVEKTKILEAISKPQIAFEGKAGADDKAQHTREYVSILKRPSTQPSGDRWGFEMASKQKEILWQQHMYY